MAPLRGRSLAEKIRQSNPKQRAEPVGSAGYPPSAISGVGGDGADNAKGGAAMTTTKPKGSRLSNMQHDPLNPPRIKPRKAR